MDGGRQHYKTAIASSVHAVALEDGRVYCVELLVAMIKELIASGSGLGDWRLGVGRPALFLLPADEMLPAVLGSGLALGSVEIQDVKAAGALSGRAADRSVRVLLPELADACLVGAGLVFPAVLVPALRVLVLRIVIKVFFRAWLDRKNSPAHARII